MRLSILCCLIAVTGSVIAQNWVPFTFDETYYYTSDTSDVIDVAFRLDTVQLAGGDSIGYFNRIIKDIPDEDCYENASQYWLGSMTKIDDGIYLFSDPGTKVLHTQAVVGEFWTYSTDPIVTAEVQHVDTMHVFGSIDSIKIILLSTGDSIILSQNFGLISFPVEDETAPVYLQLSGIGGRNVGNRLPEFRDYFDWHAGDLFQWEISDWWSDMGGDWGGSIEVIKLEVIQSVVTDTGATVELSGNRFIEVNSNKGGSSTIIPMHDTIYISPENNTFAYALPGQFMPVVADLPGIMNYEVNPYYDVTREYATDSLGITTIRQRYCDDYGENGVYIDDGFLCFGEAWDTHCMQYKVGLGWTFWKQEGVETYSDFELTAYRKDGDTVGVFLVDSEFVVGLEKQQLLKLKVFPNPANGLLFCEIPSAFQPVDFVHVVALTGVVSACPFVKSENKLTIDISTLPSGIYVLSCGNNMGNLISSPIFVSNGNE